MDAAEIASQQITVAAVFWGAAVVIGLDAIKQTGTKALLLWLLTGLFVLLGFLVRPLWNVFPDVSSFLAEGATSPVTWIILLALGYLVVRSRWIAPVAHGRSGIGHRIDAHERLLESTVEKRAALEKQVSALADQAAQNAATQRAVIDDYQRMLGLESRFWGELNGFKESVQTEHESLRMHLQVLERKLNEIKEKTRGSIHAIWMREQIHEISRNIRKDAADLSHRVSEGQKHDAQSWDSWDNVHSHWSGLMSQWWMIARFYIPNSGRVLLVPDNMYGQTKVDESLLTPVGGAEAVRVYKKFRIIQDQWEAVQEQLEHNMVLVAFSGMTELEVRHGQAVEQG